MKKRKKQLIALLACLFLWGGAGMAQAAPPITVTFQATDDPGSWFDCTGAPGCTHAPSAREKSLAIIHPGDSVMFASTTQANSLHTAVSLIYPTGAMGNNESLELKDFDVDLEPGSGNSDPIKLNTPGLYVFFCDIHPYMFAGVIVDNPATTAEHPMGPASPGDNPAYDLGTQLTLHNVIAEELPINSYSDLALRLLHTFFVATDPDNWQNYATSTWAPSYPGVPVLVSNNGISQNVGPANLNDAIQGYFGETGGKSLTAPSMPSTAKGVGQVWVDTQFETTANKPKPGTATAVNATNWNVERKVALPQINGGQGMNNPHNMWTDKNQKVIYQTQWFDNTLAVFDRESGALVRNVTVGPDPAHVMTSTATDMVHVSLNGGNDIVELSPLAAAIIRNIPMTNDPNSETHPHAHWMGHDGHTMVTPNPDTETSTLYDFAPYNAIASETPVGHFPIATGMMPDSSEYYVANFLDSTINAITIIGNSPGHMPTAGAVSKINLLPLGTSNGYNPLGLTHTDTAGHVNGNFVTGPVGLLPIQTPVSPDGNYMLTANTLSGNILVTDTKQGSPTRNQVVKSLSCDPGCHGIAFGAKKDGGYYAYVSSKFSNRMIVVDPAPVGNICRDGQDGPIPNDGTPCIVGHVLLTTANKSSDFKTDGGDATSETAPYAGMGGQGVLPIPLVYNGWVQRLPGEWKKQLTTEQKNPIGK
jgi:DNA-binding beta-propeller fold protein YncE